MWVCVSGSSSMLAPQVQGNTISINIATSTLLCEQIQITSFDGPCHSSTPAGRKLPRTRTSSCCWFQMYMDYRNDERQHWRGGSRQQHWETGKGHISGRSYTHSKLVSFLLCSSFFETLHFYSYEPAILHRGTLWWASGDPFVQRAKQWIVSPLLILSLFSSSHFLEWWGYHLESLASKL